MSGELTITVLAEKMDLKKAMRIHFAGLAMQALISRVEEKYYGGDTEDAEKLEQWRQACRQEDAEWSIKMADTMIAALEKLQ